MSFRAEARRVEVQGLASGTRIDETVVLKRDGSYLAELAPEQALQLIEAVAGALDALGYTVVTTKEKRRK